MPSSAGSLESSWLEAKKRLVNGKAVGFPTETVFGLGVDPRSSEAVEWLLKCKGRESGKGLPLIASSPELLEDLELKESSEARRNRLELQTRFWPGALTLVVEPQLNPFAKGVSPHDGSIAVRVSSHVLLGQLAASVGGFLIATSSNKAGEPPATSAEEFCSYFPDLYFIDDFPDISNPVFSSKPSTIVDVRGEVPQLLRSGDIEVGCIK